MRLTNHLVSLWLPPLQGRGIQKEQGTRSTRNNLPVTQLQHLVDLVSFASGKGWTPATGGNFSALIQREPLEFWVTASGVDKTAVTEERLLKVDLTGKPVDGKGKASDETLLHVAIYQTTHAQFVAHTHSVWNTLASLSQSEVYEITGLEMIKAVGHKSHEETACIPILPNSQDIESLSGELRNIIRKYPQSVGVLLRGHGLYTWGSDIMETKRNLEGLEFLFEVQERRKHGSA